MKKILLLVSCLLFVIAAEAKKEYKVLIVTGQSNHNWAVSSKLLRDITDKSPLFESEIYTFPAKGEDNAAHTPKFKDYDAVVMVYTGDAWSRDCEKDFEKYIKKGGAMVSFHEADNAFPDWKAFNLMTALGGWNGRDEKCGPYVYMKDGEFIKDYSKGSGGGHGKQSEYIVTTRDSEHPIMKGLPTEWLHGQDELYAKMRGPAENMTILASSFSDKETNGTGREEPVLWTVDYGKGHIFHTVLGHVGKKYPVPAVACAGFQTTYLRGLEWAITGEVTQKIPSDFPTAAESSKRSVKNYK